MTSPLWHGGVAGLGVGELLLPPACTGRPRVGPSGALGVGRPDRVYVTTLGHFAVTYAASLEAPGDVYAVEPVGRLEADDTDRSTPVGTKFAAPAARVIGIGRRGVTRWALASATALVMCGWRPPECACVLCTWSMTLTPSS